MPMKIPDEILALRVRMIRRKTNYGIYLLFNEDEIVEIVFVGISTQGTKRVFEHARKDNPYNKKQFDSYAFLPIRDKFKHMADIEDELVRMRDNFVKEYQPRYNQKLIKQLNCKKQEK